MKEEEDEEEEPLSPIARVYQSLSIDGCIVVVIIGFKTKIDPNIILDDLKQNVFKHPRFSSIVADDGTRWIKTKVNVEDHVFIPELDLEDIAEDKEKLVDDYISSLTTTFPLDRSRPLWDIHILNHKTSNAESLVVIRSHHSLGDGMSLMSLFMACTRKTSDPEASPTIQVIKRRETASQNLRNACWFLRSMFTIYSTLILIKNTLVDLLFLLATILFLKDTKTSLKAGDLGIESNPKRFCHRIVPLNDIKLVKNAMNMTINDVLLGVTQAGLSRYLNQPCGTRVRAGVFVNLRSDIGIKPLADMMAKDSKCRWGNHICMIISPLHIDSETDPLVYLSKAKSTMDRTKNSLQAPILYSMIGFILKVFGAKVGATLVERTLLHTTTSFSNIIGPIEEISFHGYPIAYIAPSVYGHSQALMIHFQSYADKMVISLGVDTTIIEDPYKLCDEMEESLKDMKEAVSKRRLCS